MKALRPAAFGLLALAGPTLAWASGHEAPASPAPRRVHEVTTPRVPPPAPRTSGRIVLSVPDFDGDTLLAFAWPADGPVTSTYGRRRSGWHRGIDIKAELGTPVLAAAPGTVIMSGVEQLYGRVIKIEHEQGFVTIYAHNDRNLVEVGDRVAAGETIATAGRTGRATTHHVHFEIMRDGKYYNPLYLLPLPPRLAQVDETDENPPDE